MFKVSGLCVIIPSSSGQVIPNGDWDADARATSQFRPGHGAGASGMWVALLLELVVSCLLYCSKGTVVIYYTIEDVVRLYVVRKFKSSSE